MGKMLSPLGFYRCPYCKKPVTSGKVVILRRGGYAHATCKTSHEQQLRDERAAARRDAGIKRKLEEIEKTAWQYKKALVKGGAE